MKRIIVCVLSILLLTFIFCLANAEGEREITFQAIPWLSDESAVFSDLIAEGFLQDEFSLAGVTLDAEMIYLEKDDDLNVRWSKDPQYQEASYGLSIKHVIAKKIAGYNVDEIHLTFAKDGTRRALITVKVNLHNGDYQDIREKLIAVYGESLYVQTDEDIWVDAWLGADDSCILLFTESQGTKFDLIYGRLDSLQILEECLESMNAKVK